MEHPVRAHRIAFVIQQELADSHKRNQIIYILMMDMLDLQLCMYEQQQAALCMYLTFSQTLALIRISGFG